jgi:phosphate:Na+ symporter
MLVGVIGGIGLFLLGMVLMADALKAMAGDAMRRILSRFVSGPVSAITSGAVSTMLVQSSSATTLTTIGFVSAGLITFHQAIGVILGANLGTTSIGWIVAVFGFKVDISLVTLPLVGVGALMRLLLRGRWAQLGLVLSGFGLIFVGIATLQDAMHVLAEQIDLSRFAQPTFAGRLVLVVVGAAMTVLMQASGAAVATTLAALHSGAIDIEQAAALVIGQNVGTTVKVILVAIGATTPVKRTAAAHILFNVITAAVAFALLSPFVWLVATVGHWLEPQPGVLTIAAFHTAFNVLGIALFLPWLGGFSRLVARLVPERGSALTRHLDRAVAAVPSAAIEAARRCVMDIAARVIAAANVRLRGDRGATAAEQALDESQLALVEVRRFLGQMNADADSSPSRREYDIHLATLHAVDHLDSLIKSLQQRDKVRLVATLSRTAPFMQQLVSELSPLRAWLDGEPVPQVADRMAAVSRDIAEHRRTLRADLLQRTARSELQPDDALHQIEALQWIDRVGYHVWRTAHHLEQATTLARGGTAAPAPTDGDAD